MSFEGFQPVSIGEAFGGLCTVVVDATDVPPGMSPDCQDVEFTPGGVQTRPGTISAFGALFSIPTAASPAIPLSVNSIKNYIDTAYVQRLVALCSDGTLRVEGPPGTLTVISTTVPTASYMKSVTAFGAEYMAVSDGHTPLVAPLYYDGTQLARVSHGGPIFENPGLKDDPGFTAATSAIARAANVVTATTTSDQRNFIFPGMLVDVSGTTDAGFNGTGFVVTVVTATQVKWAQTGGNASSANSVLNAYIKGHVTAGQHSVAVAYEYASGYITRLSPFTTYTAQNGVTQRQLNIGQLPLGPPGVVARIVAMTTTSAAGPGPSFYFSPLNWNQPVGGSVALGAMRVPDNTTTAVNIDVDDITLAASTNADYLRGLEVVPHQIGVTEYAARLAWWGEENQMQFWQNLGFDAGLRLETQTPAGWTRAANATSPPENTVPEYVDTLSGSALRVQTDGTTLPLSIQQTAYLDVFQGTPLIQPQKAYTVKMRVKASAGLTAGTLVARLAGIDQTGAAFFTAGLAIGFAQMTAAAGYQEFTGSLTDKLTAGQVNANLILQLYFQQPNAGASILIEEIRIFPTASPSFPEVVRFTYAGLPEASDATKQLVDLSLLNRGYQVRSCFTIGRGGLLYMAKERGLYVTQDDGINEPSDWAVEEVSPTVGTLSTQGVGVGDDFAIIASRDALYYFDGSLRKISGEVQRTWQLINWDFGHLLWVKVNTNRQRVYIGAPFGQGQQSVNKVLVLDYQQDTSAYYGGLLSDPIQNGGSGRKWTMWSIGASSGEVVYTDSLTREFFGSSTNLGAVVELTNAATSDFGGYLPDTGDAQAGNQAPDRAIDGYYDTHFVNLGEGEGLVLAGYLTGRIRGSGTLLLSVKLQNNQVLGPQKIALSDPALADLQAFVDQWAERVSIRLETKGVTGNDQNQFTGDYFKAAKVMIYISNNPSGMVR